LHISTCGFVHDCQYAFPRNIFAMVGSLMFNARQL
jgi:hypothetical protein